MAALSEWLQIMLAEIARKREDLERAREEDIKRDSEKVGDAALPSDAAPPTKVARAS
jgi:hypothetical protein